MPEKGQLFRKLIVKAYYQATEWLYGPLAWAYDIAAWTVSFGDWARWRRAALDYLVPGRILETGFGTGSLLIEMSSRGIDVVGLDPSWQMQRVTHRKASRKGQRVRRLCGQSKALPFPHGSFSDVVSTFPTNYISDEETLFEVRRVLSPGGRWVIVGVGLRFTSPVKQFFMGWLLGDWENAWIQSFLEKACLAGFRPTLTKHETDGAVLSVLILEIPHEN